MKPAGDTKASPALKVRCEPSSPVTTMTPSHARGAACEPKSEPSALREHNAPLSGLGFPYSGIEPAVVTLEQIGRCLGGIAGEDTVSLWALAVRLRKRVLETDNLRHGFPMYRLCVFHHRSLLSREGDRPDVSELVAKKRLRPCIGLLRQRWHPRAAAATREGVIGVVLVDRDQRIVFQRSADLGLGLGWREFVARRDVLQQQRLTDVL